MSEKFQHAKEQMESFVESTKVMTAVMRHNNPAIDAAMLPVATEASSRNPLFRVAELPFDESERPDAIRHELTVLPPRYKNVAERDHILSMVSFLIGEDENVIREEFHESVNQHDLFNRLDKKQNLIFVGNHLDMADLGFTAALFHSEAQKNGYTNPENILNVVIGRIVGYFEVNFPGLDGEFKWVNVMDDVLRKASTVIKSFPPAGGESMDVNEFENLKLVREYYNHKTKQAVHEKFALELGGKALALAGSGAQDRITEDKVIMGRYGKGTAEMIVDAVEYGAVVVPYFADIGPIKGEKGSAFKILSPRKPRSIEEVHQIAVETANVGTDIRIELGRKVCDVVYSR